ncbi:hypothetical protein DEDE109153_08950 [Deinococcus deserti]
MACLRPCPVIHLNSTVLEATLALLTGARLAYANSAGTPLTITYCGEQSHLTTPFSSGALLPAPLT